MLIYLSKETYDKLENHLNAIGLRGQLCNSNCGRDVTSRVFAIESIIRTGHDAVKNYIKKEANKIGTQP